MTTEARSSAAQTAAESSKATETLSQFVARVLNQLSLSAWLPAAALVLLLTFVIELGTALDASLKSTNASPSPPVIQALKSITGISLGGALLLISAVVVLTMVTQAFSFEAIRFLEGYWGTGGFIERVAKWRCSRHRNRREMFNRRLQDLTKQAWEGARLNIEAINDRLTDLGKPTTMTPNVIAAIRVRALGKKNSVRLNEAEKKTLERIAPRWQQWAPAEVLRRRTNVRTRLRDYPKPSRILPTKLGNVLRRHEDDAGVTDQTFVQQIFEGIPLLIKIEHDEQRTRLDLYCSMVFVVLVVTLVAVARFAAHHLSYAVFAAAIGLSAMWLMYRAGVASARAYGSLLVVIARHVKQAPPGSETDKKQPK